MVEEPTVVQVVTTGSVEEVHIVEEPTGVQVTVARMIIDSSIVFLSVKGG